MPEAVDDPDVRALLAWTYWKGRLDGQLKPGFFVKLVDFEKAAVAEGARPGDLPRVYADLLAAKQAAGSVRT